MKNIKNCLLTVMAASSLLAGNVLASNAYQGWQLYNTYCMVCHGVNGDGKGPLADKLGKGNKPANLTDATKVGKRSDKEIFQVIEGTADHAKINGDMPRWGMAIPGPQIDSLVAYVRFLHDSKYPVIGNPEKGKEIYLKSCATCHGTRGKGDGVMTNLLSMKPADHSNSGKMAEMSNERLVRIVKNGAEDYMPAWQGILTEQEIQSVVGYIRLLSY